MRKKTQRPFVVLVGFIFASLILGCSGSTTEATLAIIQKDTITTQEFEQAYLRTRYQPAANDSDKQVFLNLMIDYKVKLSEARKQKLDKQPALRSELELYSKQLANSFYLEKELIEPALHTLYNRRLEEVKGQHILIKFLYDSQGHLDTLSTRSKAENILGKVLASKEPFDSLITKYSDEPSQERNHGQLNWMIAGTTIPELDDMMYSLKIGQIEPTLLRSRFGYHIIQLTGKKKARQRVRASQILYRLDINAPLDTAAGFARLSLVRDSLVRGLATFEDLARRNSQDPVSGETGGDLGWLGRGTNLEENFEAAVFNLKPGELSPIVRSAFGMHLIKLTDEEPPLSFDHQKGDLKQVYQRERFATDYRNFLEALRKKYHYTLSPDVVRMLISRLDTAMITTSTPNWDAVLSQRDREAYLFRLTSGVCSIQKAIDAIRANPELQMKKFTPESLDTIGQAIANEMILNNETANISRDFPEFLRLFQEYSESALISSLEQTAVWDKAVITDDMLQKYWTEHQGEYSWPKRVRYSEIYLFSRPIAESIIDSAKAGIPFEDLAYRHTRRPGYFSKHGDWGWQPVDKDELSRKAALMEVGEVSEIIDQTMGLSILKVTGKESPRTKTFEEAKPELLGIVKEQTVKNIQRNWLDSLRQEFQVTVFPEHLKKTFTRTSSPTRTGE